MRGIAFGMGLLLIGCGTFIYGLGQTNAVEQSDSAEPAELKPVDVNMHDFMEGMFQAPYRRLKQAMANQPADNPAWKALRSDALILAEGSNLLLLRKPEKDAEAWAKYSVDSRAAGEEVVKAGKQRDFAAAKAAYEKMLTHCNACHKQFDNGKHQLEP